MAETLFGKLNYDGYFLEYDTDRAGGFEPLRFVPKARKQIVLGLVSSSSARWKARTTSSAASTRPPSTSPWTNSASRRSAALPLPRKATSLSEDEQWAKLRMIVELTDEVWK